MCPCAFLTCPCEVNVSTLSLPLCLPHLLYNWYGAGLSLTQIQREEFMALVFTDLLSSIYGRASSFKDEALRRLRSFNSTDDESGDNLEMSPPPEPRPSPNPETIIPIDSHEVEGGSAAHESTSAAAETTGDDFGRVVQTVALFFAASSFGLIMNPLPSAKYHLLLVTAHTTFVYLSLFLGVGLSIYSLLMPSSPQVVQTQKKVMVIAFVFISFAFVLHTCAVLPVASLVFVWLLFLLVSALVLQYLFMTRERDGYHRTVSSSNDAVV